MSGSGEGMSDEKERVTQGPGNVEEIASKSLRIQNKRYYVDVKQNQRGKFIKLVEVFMPNGYTDDTLHGYRKSFGLIGDETNSNEKHRLQVLNNGSRNKLHIPMSQIPDVRDKLTTFADFYASLDPSQVKDVGEDGRLKSEMFRADRKRYYFDLKENQRGRFLRISQTGSMGPRSTLALPAQGIVDIRNALSEFLEEYGSSEEPASEEEELELPQAKEMRVERKRFYFDCGRNSRGSFLRVSEVTSNFRSSVTIPRQGLAKFKEIIVDLADEMQA